LELDDLRNLQQIGEASVLQAGRALTARRGAWAQAELEVGHDVKLVGDRGAEGVIIELLRTSSQYSVYSEEAGWVGDPSTAIHWVLDPLDGSANYLRDVPLCCVSLALVDGEEPLLGIVYDFNRDELFTGVVGDGAYLNGQPMHVSSVSDQAQALLTTGFPVAMDYGSDALRDYVADVQAYRKVRSLGTAALMLAYVASGRFDVYRERTVRFWDVAAGMALVIAAGGETRVSAREAGSGARLDLLAWNGSIAL
jgi:myo-inositol-1(or 4)-monophosphatase